MANPPAERPQWFSIKEAATYLDIGEPTLYRWMRDGKITFRKVGDSTRFLQEDLDAFVQVVPSARDAEKTRVFCPVCHHDELADGVLRSTGLTYFQPAKTRFWTFQDSTVKTAARMCTRCGAINLYGNLDKLVRLQPTPKTPKGNEPPAGE
jgi:excisionase family DNA binding protein